MSRSTGDTYYFNTYTMETTYDFPIDVALPPGWEPAVSKSTGSVYYVNTFTAATQYDPPTEPADGGDDGLGLEPTDEAAPLMVGTEAADSAAPAPAPAQEPEPAPAPAAKKGKKNKQKPRKPFFSCGTPQADSSRRKKLTEPEPEVAIPSASRQPEPEPEPEREPEQPVAESAAEYVHSSEHEAAPGSEGELLVLPLGWEAVVSRSTNSTYYHNTMTAETTYDFPTQPALSPEEMAQLEAALEDDDQYDDGIGEELARTVTADGHKLPDGWEVQTSRSTGEEYFHNVSTGETTYEFPK